MANGVISAYSSFRRTIQQQRKKFAFLQLVGRLEEFLVKEFIYHIHRESKGKRFGVTNVGRKSDRQKFDIAILSGRLDDLSEAGKLDDPCIVGLVEAKYIRNWHRAWKSNAQDETATSFKSLAAQLRFLKSPERVGRYRVKLLSRSEDIYGLVFASYVSDKKDIKEKENFFKGQLEKAQEYKFRYHDQQKPYFKKVYDDVKLIVLGGTRYASLRVGLWKLSH